VLLEATWLYPLPTDKEEALSFLLSEAPAAAAGQDPDQAIVEYQVAAESSGLSASTLAQVEVRLGYYCLSQDKPAAAMAYLKQALQRGQEQADERIMGEAKVLLSWAHRWVSEFALARLYANQAITYFQQVGDHHALAMAYYEAGGVEFHRGNYARAMIEFRLAGKLIDPESDPALYCNLEGSAALACMFMGDLPAARLGYEKTLQVLKRAGPFRRLARHCSNLGFILTLLGEWEEAKRLLERALEISRQVGDHRTEASTFDTLGKLLVLQGQTAQGKLYLEKAITAFTDTGDEWPRFDPLVNLTQLYLLTGETEAASATAREALSLAQRLDHRDFMVFAHLAQAELELTRQDFLACHQSLWAAEERLTEEPTLPILAAARQLAGRLAAAEGNFDEARQLLAHSLSAFETLKDRYQIGISSLALGHALLEAGLSRQAQSYTARALEIFTNLRAEPARRRAVEVYTRCTTSHLEAEASTGNFSPSGARHRVRARATEYPLKRLIDAACSEEMLLRELVAVSSDLANTEEVMLFRLKDDRTATALLHRGCSDEQVSQLEWQVAAALARDQWPLAEGPYTVDNTDATLLVFNPKSQKERLALYLSASHGLPDIEEHRRLKLALKLAKQGLESYALRLRLSQAWQPGLPAPLEPFGFRSLRAMPHLIVAGPVMRDLLTLITCICNSETPVLITGESGTGKELIARAIHLEGPRRHDPFMPFNCTTLGRETAESQLFGHHRGSFTGAVSDYPGIIRAAEGGSLFLDEIGDLSLEIQPKLLRFLQDGEVFPLGAKGPTKTNVRVIAATNHQLEEDIKAGRFRRDLFHRLNVIRLEIPPLRRRREEIPVFIAHYFERYKQEEQKHDLALSHEVVELMKFHDWPGNVRELSAEIRRLVVFAAAGEVISAEKLSPEIAQRAQARATSPEKLPDSEVKVAIKDDVTLAEAVEELERQMITRALEKAGGNLTHAAHSLKLTIKGLKDKMKRLGVQRTPAPGRQHSN